MKKEIKNLYKKDIVLAKKVAKILGYKIKIKAKYYKQQTISIKNRPARIIDIFFNPTSKEYREIMSTNRSIRLAVTKDKNIYAWSGDILHDHMLPYLESELKGKRFLRLSGTFKSNHLEIDSVDEGLNIAKDEYPWLFNRDDISFWA